MARTDNFNKFVKKPKGSAIKEKIKQEKKKEKKERAAAIEAHFQRKREEKLRQRGIDPASLPAKTGKGGKSSTTNKYAAKAARPAHKPSPQNSGKQDDAFAKHKSLDKAPFKQTTDRKSDSKKPYVPGKKQTGETKSSPNHTPDSTTKPSFKKQAAAEHLAAGTNKRDTPKPSTRSKAAAPSTRTDEKRHKPVDDKRKTPADNKQHKPADARQQKPTDNKPQRPSISTKEVGTMPLNKYIAHSGICARRDAAELVKQGKVTVNEQLVIEPGTKVSEYDIVKVSGKTITISKNFVYILLNKPKDYITTSEDPQGRKTVLDLVRTATEERVYPVGRLDRNTSGVLLLTNDGDLAQKLSHPKHEVKKVYEVRLDRALTKADMEKIGNGITLEDGFVAPDVIAYADSKDKSIIGIEIHSGRNRIVRRIFEHMKYDVKGLDRVMYAGLTKKDVLRGNWRFLKDKEVRLLKYMNQSYVKGKD
jgi:23S rRNA pseudouridine2605 synthase